MRHTIWTALEMYKEFLQSQSTGSPLKNPGPFFADFSLVVPLQKIIQGEKRSKLPWTIGFGANIRVYELPLLGIWRHGFATSSESAEC